MNKIYLLFLLFIITEAYSAELNYNFFERYCLKNYNGYYNCDFSHVNDLPFEQKSTYELEFELEYTFKDCNFKKLNFEIYSNIEVIEIIEGHYLERILGHSLNSKDVYSWDTNTNTYSDSCFFSIDSIKASFSEHSKEKIRHYIDTYKLIESNQRLYKNALENLISLKENLAFSELDLRLLLAVFNSNISKISEDHSNSYINLIILNSFQIEVDILEDNLRKDESYYALIHSNLVHKIGNLIDFIELQIKESSSQMYLNILNEIVKEYDGKELFDDKIVQEIKDFI